MHHDGTLLAVITKKPCAPDEQRDEVVRGAMTSVLKGEGGVVVGGTTKKAYLSFGSAATATDFEKVGFPAGTRTYLRGGGYDTTAGIRVLAAVEEHPCAHASIDSTGSRARVSEAYYFLREEKGGRKIGNGQREGAMGSKGDSVMMTLLPFLAVWPLDHDEK